MLSTNCTVTPARQNGQVACRVPSDSCQLSLYGLRNSDSLCCSTTPELELWLSNSSPRALPSSVTCLHTSTQKDINDLEPLERLTHVVKEEAATGIIAPKMAIAGSPCTCTNSTVRNACCHALSQLHRNCTSPNAQKLSPCGYCQLQLISGI